MSWVVESDRKKKTYHVPIYTNPKSLKEGGELFLYKPSKLTSLTPAKRPVVEPAPKSKKGRGKGKQGGRS